MQWQSVGVDLMTRDTHLHLVTVTSHSLLLHVGRVFSVLCVLVSTVLILIFIGPLADMRTIHPPLHIL